MANKKENKVKEKKKVQPLKINASFEDVMQLCMLDADKKVKEREKQKAITQNAIL